MSPAPPKISCLMVTADRRRFVRRSLLCYRRQTYPRKELVVVDDGSEPLEDLLTGFPPGEIVYRKIEKKPENVLGRLRNLSMELATGDLLTYWDDDDWYHSDRLSAQAGAMGEGIRSCVLGAALVHLDTPAYFQHPFLAPFRNGVPASLMFVREGHPRFPALRRGEDSVFMRHWRKRPHRVLARAQAHLMIRCYHGDNTWDRAHFLKRLSATGPDLLRSMWYRGVRRDILEHPLFRLSAEARGAFGRYLEDSRSLGLFDG